jgi:hypothetical protein
MASLIGPAFGISLELPDLNAGGGDGASAAGGDTGAGAVSDAGGGAGATGGEKPGGGSSADAGGGASGAAGSGGQPQKEELYDIVVNGKTERLTRADIIARAQQGTDYTGKTQRLAAERKQWETDRQTVLQQEREKWQRDNAAALERARQEGTRDPGERAMAHSQRLEQKLEDQSLDITLSRILPKFEGITEKDFLKEAQALGLTTAEQVAQHGERILSDMVKAREDGFNSRFDGMLAKGDHPSLVKFREAAIAKYLEGKTAKPSPATNTNGSAPPTGPGAPRRAKTFEEAADIADEMLRAAAAS